MGIFNFGFKKKFKKPIELPNREPFKGATIQLVNAQFQKWEIECAKGNLTPFILIANNENGQDTVFCPEGMPISFFRERILKMLKAIDRGAKIQDLKNMSRQ